MPAQQHQQQQIPTPSTAAKVTETLKAEILGLVERYHAAAARLGAAGDSSSSSLASLVGAVLDSETPGHPPAVAGFEAALAKRFGVREAVMVNSGSSANLLALSALTSPRMGRLQLKPGDEVITIAAGSPSLASAIVQNQLVPVFADIALPDFNIDPRQLQQLISPRTRAVALPHLYGNPFDLDAVSMFAALNNLLLIEDCRQAAGASFSGRPVGCFGQFSSVSFGADRQLAAGGGGALFASSPLYRSIAESLRDGGSSEESGTPRAQAGYNLRGADVQAAMGLSQLPRLEERVAARAEAAQQITAGLAAFADVLITPDVHRLAKASWSALPVAVRESAPFQRDQLVAALEADGVACRAFAPSLAAQPAFAQPQRKPLRKTDFAVRHGLVFDLSAARMIEAVSRTIRNLLGR